jgi:tRNA pseudouridine55 synthase
MNGILIVDKDKDYTSRDIVNLVEKKLNYNRVGHAGTLDPLATGVLVVALGDALKILEFINDSDKEYIATAKMGLLTDTLDVTGKVLKENNNFNITKEELESTLNSFKGSYLQEVPLYSSVKVNGKRLYKYAREEKQVVLPKREVNIFSIELLSFNKDEFTFKVNVSKGTYIRSLIRDIGDKLNIPCVMKELRRTRQGIFKIEDSVKVDDIDNNIKLISIEDALNDITFIEVDSFLENKILNGRILDNRYSKEIIGFKNKERVIALYQVYDKDNTKIKPIKVFK